MSHLYPAADAPLHIVSPVAAERPRFVVLTDIMGHQHAINPAMVTYLYQLRGENPPATWIQFAFSYDEDGAPVKVPLSLHDTLAQLDPTPPLVQQIMATNLEYESLFALQGKRMTEATRRWRLAHPGKEHVIPDLGELLHWLLGEIDKAGHV